MIDQVNTNVHHNITAVSLLRAEPTVLLCPPMREAPDGA